MSKDQKAKTAANAPTEVEANTFVHNISAYIKKVDPSRENTAENDPLNVKVSIRAIDGEDFDKIFYTLFGGKGASDWIQDGAHFASEIKSDRKYNDHSAKFISSGNTICEFPDVVIKGFKVNLADMGITFDVTAKNIAGGDVVGKLSNFLKRTVFLKLTKAPHWSNNSKDQQETLPIGNDPEKTKKVEKAKEVANKANTDKARKRVPVDDENKARARAKAKAKADALPKKEVKPKAKSKAKLKAVPIPKADK